MFHWIFFYFENIYVEIQQNNVEPQIPVKPKLRESSPSTSSQELLDETTDTGQELEITEGVYANGKM